MKISVEQMSGYQVEYHASKRGSWEVTTPEAEEILGTGDTLEEAKNRARAQLAKRKVKVEVPFLTSRTFVRGVATGIHAGTNNVLVRTERPFARGEKTEQLTGYGSREVLRADMPDEAKFRLQVARAMEREAASKIRAIEREYGMDLRGEVREAIDREVERKLERERERGPLTEADRVGQPLLGGRF